MPTVATGLATRHCYRTNRVIPIWKISTVGQPLALRTFIDQAGNPAASEPEFIGAEWGRVVPFALTEHDLKIHERDGVEYWLYHDPGSPPSI